MRQVNIQDTMSYVCKAFTFYNDMNTPLYLAYRKSKPEMPLTYGSTKEDFYPVEDVLDEIFFMETTPLKYLILLHLNASKVTRLIFKLEIAFAAAMMLEERTETKQKLTREILAKAVVDVQQYFWGFSSNAILYCVRRDRYGYTGTVSQCERELRELPYEVDIKYLCTEGTISNAFSHNPYMKYHIDKWEQYGVKERVLKLRDEFIKVIETALLLEKSAMKTAI